MRKIAFLFIILLSAIRLQAPDVKSICKQLNALNMQILEGSVPKTVAAVKFRALIVRLKAKGTVNSTDWIFPLKGYKAGAIGGTRGNGYNAKGYNFFDGNKHTAHPAHDIFIRDANQDCLDDQNKRTVPVLAVADGIVIACTNSWAEGSSLRGGRFIWVYHSALNIISYYAHNRMVDVQPGDEVKQSQQIAEVGRTGLNASKKRSPTHLHFGAYHLVNGLPMPFNPYQLLVKAQTK